MVSVSLKDVAKRFGAVVACNDITFNVKEGEFFTLLGPSGCGKTTVLRIVAGFYYPDEGSVLFDGVDVTGLPPYERNTGMVFQNYALWPHMTVFDNVAYGLKIRKLPAQEIKKRVKEALRLVRLEGLEERTPYQLSGGQQQRVALARALVVEPKVLLLDEPLSNLDAKLRVATRIEITKLQRRLGITTIYVTHDQEEALCISDRVAVMRDGNIIQIGSPRDVYEKPATAFVADFIGVANLLQGWVSKLSHEPPIATVDLEDGAQLRAEVDGRIEEGEQVYVTFRPEAAIIAERGKTHLGMGNILEGRVHIATYLGNLARYEVETNVGLIRVDVPNPIGKKLLPEGEEVRVYFEPSNCRILPRRELR